MHNPIIVVGIGELGSVFARGFLKLGYPVQAVNRQQSMQQLAQKIPHPQAVLVAVGESDIAQTLQAIPTEWQQDLILLQNELLPRDWQAADIENPTVISVWFEKKKGMDSKVVLPSPVFGKHSKLVFNALSTLDLPCIQLDTPAELLFELVRKNLYILTTNIAGLKTGGNVAELAESHAELMNDVAQDVMDIQDALTGSKNDRKACLQGMLEAFQGDPQHGCMGRSAPVRLARAIDLADQHSLDIPTLRRIQQDS